MCMMNNNNEEAFNVGGQCKKNTEHFNVGGQTHKEHKEHFNVGGQGNGKSNGNNKCHITMVWADWCGYSKKAKPEWDKLTQEYEGKEIDGCIVTFEHAEEKEKPEIVKKFKTTGFPTYYVSMNDSKHEEFNSIKKDDMLEKIKTSISKIKGSGNSKPAPNKPAPSKPAPNKPHKPAHKPAPNKPHKPAPNKPAPSKPHNKPAPNGNRGNYARDYNSVRSTIEGEILYSSCGDGEYGPLRLDSVDRNLTGIGNSIQNVMGFGDCTELEFAPVKFSTGGPQIPSMNSLLPSLAQLPAAPIDGIQGIHRPASFNSPPNGNKPGNGGNGGGNGGNGGNGGAKKAQVTMVRADWCGFCKKAMPEWEKLKSEIHNKVVNGYHIVLKDLEQKRDEAEIKEKYSEVTGFPTYVVETTDSSGKLVKSGTFNSIEKDDMHEKIKQNLP